VTVCATLITGYWGLSLECSWRHCCVVCSQFPRHSLYPGWCGGVCNPGHRPLGAQFGRLVGALLCLLSLFSPLFVPRVACLHQALTFHCVAVCTQGGVVVCDPGHELLGAKPGGIKLSDGRQLQGGGKCVAIAHVHK